LDDLAERLNRCSESRGGAALAATPYRAMFSWKKRSHGRAGGFWRHARWPVVPSSIRRIDQLSHHFQRGDGVSTWLRPTVTSAGSWHSFFVIDRLNRTPLRVVRVDAALANAQA